MTSRAGMPFPGPAGCPRGARPLRRGAEGTAAVSVVWPTASGRFAVIPLRAVGGEGTRLRDLAQEVTVDAVHWYGPSTEAKQSQPLGHVAVDAQVSAQLSLARQTSCRGAQATFPQVAGAVVVVVVVVVVAAGATLTVTVAVSVRRPSETE